MYFRFGFAVVLVVLISLTAIAVEKENLALRRELSRQHYRMDLLREQHIRLRLRSQELAAVDRLLNTAESTEGSRDRVTRQTAPATPEQREMRTPPLLFWQQPLLDPRLQKSD